MENWLNATCLFSGRFDRPHPGHILTILQLGFIFRKVLVVVLDYPEQKYPVQYRVQLLQSILEYAMGEYEVVSNESHFARIVEEDLSKFKFDVYASGNIECLKHIEELGRKVTYVNRSFDYSASEEYEKEK